jgi:hypothetical protein
MWRLNWRGQVVVLCVGDEGWAVGTAFRSVGLGYVICVKGSSKQCLA